MQWAANGKMHDTSYDMRSGAIVIADGLMAERLAADAVELAGCRVVNRYAWAGSDRLRDHGAIDLLAIDTRTVPDGMLDAVLPVIDHVAQDNGARIVAAIDLDQIDIVSASLFGRHVQLLVAPTMAEQVAALTIAGAMRLDGHVNEAGDAEASRLRRLNEEVARIAETLARLTRSDVSPTDRTATGVGDRALGYGVSAANDGAWADGTAVTAHDLRQSIRARRLRQQFFESRLLEDPGWDMLLDLYAAELERAQVSVSSLCIAAAVAPTTALRWIGKMTDAELFVRIPDPFDRRRAYMELTEKARSGMRAYCSAARRAGLPIA